VGGKRVKSGWENIYGKWWGNAGKILWAWLGEQRRYLKSFSRYLTSRKTFHCGVSLAQCCHGKYSAIEEYKANLIIIDEIIIIIYHSFIFILYLI